MREAIWISVLAMIFVNDTETPHLRQLDIAPSSSAPMSNKLIPSAKEQSLVIRCQCGNVLRAESEESLVDKVRLHIGEFHPDVGDNIPADLILAMAEEKEK